MSIKSALWLTCLLSVLLLSIDTRAQQGEWHIFKVPPAIDVKQNISTIPDGWTPSQEQAKHVLAGITVFDGRPEEMASLVYNHEVEQKAKHRMILSWHLYANSKDGIWLRCSYAATNVVLSAPLPPNVKELRVTYDTNVHIDGLPQIVRIEYR